MSDGQIKPSELTRSRAKDLRRNQTPQEAVLWTALRARRSGGITFRRQHPVGTFVLDFFCMRAGLAVELDGWVHDDLARRAADERRTRWLEEHAGIDVLRFTNEEVVLDVERVCDEIWREAAVRIAVRAASAREEWR